jgi:glycosyltransferase involved in cell wall biosynthesis
METLRPTRVLHFVSGGFSGATQVAVDLVKASLHHPGIEPLLVLRHKRQTPQTKYEALKQQGVPLDVVSGALNLLSIWQLVQVCKRFAPDVLVAHGFPEHIIGRHAGVWAKVPRLIHVEHNVRERYSWSRLQQARWLAKRTEHIVGVSEGVKAHLLALGFAADKVISIPNGIDVARFLPAQPMPLVSREKAIVMAARFAKQKDHATLIQAVAQLAQQGHPDVRLYLAGGGNTRYQAAAQTLVQQLGMAQHVQFVGHCPDMPGLLQRCAVCVLSTHYEGLALSAIEGMAAGCLTLGSDVVGVQEIITPGVNGYLFAAGNAPALAARLAQVFDQLGHMQALADAGMQTAQQRYSRQRMLADYMALMVRG